MTDDSRVEEIARLAAALERRHPVRLQMLGVVTLAWLAGFLASFVLMHAGLAVMAVRYAIATIVGYGVFIVAVRLWLLGAGSASSLPALPSLRDDGRPARWWHVRGLGRLGGHAAKQSSDSLFKGGRSGGAGASALWDAGGSPVQPILLPPSPAPAPSSSGFGTIKVKGKNAVPIIAVAIIVIGLAVVGRVVWQSPNLVAEMLVDGALAGGALRGAARASRQRDIGVIAHTRIPAVIVLVLMIALGWAGQSLRPDAVSIGDLFR